MTVQEIRKNLISDRVIKKNKKLLGVLKMKLRNEFNQEVGRKFTSRMGREIDQEKLVGVHWNAHKKVWSIVQMKSRHTTGLVLGYASQVTLRDVTTHIDNSKQKTVIATGKKDRHAFMVGYLENLSYEALEKNIYYSPKQVKDFVDAETFFKCGEVNYIDNVERVSMDFNFEKNHPVVKYSA